MYSLLARIPDGLNPLRSRFELHVKKAGLSAIEKIAEQEGDAIVSIMDSAEKKLGRPI
jgi:cullin 1